MVLTQNPNTDTGEIINQWVIRPSKRISDSAPFNLHCSPSAPESTRFPKPYACQYEPARPWSTMAGIRLSCLGKLPLLRNPTVRDVVVSLKRFASAQSIQHRTRSFALSLLVCPIPKSLRPVGRYHKRC